MAPINEGNQTLAARWRAMAEAYAAQQLGTQRGRALIERIAGVEDTTMSHEECLAALPEYITAELSGLNVARKYPEVQYHLERCPTCEEEYAELLTIEMALAPAERDIKVPQPTLTDFAYRQKVKEMSEQAVQKIEPGIAPLSLVMIDPMLDTLAAGGKVTVPPVSNDPAGLGGLELAVTVVVPVIVNVLSTIIVNYLERQLKRHQLRELVREELQKLLDQQEGEGQLKANAPSIVDEITKAIAESLGIL